MVMALYVHIVVDISTINIYIYTMSDAVGHNILGMEIKAISLAQRVNAG